MPRLPDVTDLGDRPTPTFRGRVASQPNAGVIGDAIAGIGAQANRVGEQMLDKQDRFHYAAAEAELLEADVAVRAELEKDQDYGTFASRYAERMAAARARAAGLIRNSSDRALFEAQAGIQFERGNAEVLKMADGKRVVAEKATLSTGIKKLQTVGRGALDDATRTATITAMDELIRGAEERGLLSPLEAIGARENAVGDYSFEQVQMMINREDYTGAQALLLLHGDKLDMERRLALEGRLKSALDFRQAQDDVSGVMGVPQPEGGADVATERPSTLAGFMAKTRGAESGGNDNARAGTSSATGRYQFTDGTWLATYAKVFGKTGESQAQILAKRSNGAIQDQLMARLTNDNAITLRGANLPVNDANLYLAHFLGAAGAVKLLKAGPQAATRSVIDPQALSANKAVFQGKETVGEVIAWAASKMGQAAQQAPREHNLTDIYAQLDARAAAEGWTPERTERAKQEADRRVSRDEGLLRRERDAAMEAALNIADQLDDKFIDISQIPNAASLDVRDRMRLEDIARANAKPASVAANGETALGLGLMEIYEPEAFKALDLRQYRGSVTAAEFEGLALRQAKARTAPAEGGADSTRSAISTTIAFHAPDINLDPKKYKEAGTKERREYLEIHRLMDAELQRETGGKRKPTQAELDRAFSNATMAVTVKEEGILWDSTRSVRRSSARSLGIPTQINVPADARSRIISNYRQAYGRNPDQKQIAEEYLKYRGKPGFWK